VPRSTNTRSAFSLIELITALAVSSILVGSMGVVLVTASSALERGEGPGDGDRVAAEALTDLQADLAETIEFYERTATVVSFAVPDRNGNNRPERIRYSWSGTPGDPLLRSTNGGTAGVVAANVQQLDLSYKVRPGLTRSTSAERLIASFTAHTGATNAFDLTNSTEWSAEVFRPTFAADAVSWTASKVRLRLRRNGSASGSLEVSVRSVTDANTPGATVYASLNIAESALSSTIRWEDVLFPACNPIPAGSPVAIVVRGVSGAEVVCDVGYLINAAPNMPFNLWRCATDNSGGTWGSYGQTQNVLFEIYGTVVSEAP